jgi:hypothetical protein
VALICSFLELQQHGKIGVLVPKEAHCLNRENGGSEFHTLILVVVGGLGAAVTAGFVRTVFFVGLVTVRLIARVFFSVAFFSGRALEDLRDTAESFSLGCCLVLRCFNCEDSRRISECPFAGGVPRLPLMVPSARSGGKTVACVSSTRFRLAVPPFEISEGAGKDGLSEVFAGWGRWSIFEIDSSILLSVIRQPSVKARKTPATHRQAIGINPSDPGSPQR